MGSHRSAPLLVALTVLVLLASGGAVTAAARPSHSKLIACDGAQRVNPYEDRAGFVVGSVRGTSCHHGATVIRRVAQWADYGRRDLGVSRHPATYGYTCTVKLVGPDVWDIRCRRGARYVHGGASR